MRCPGRGPGGGKLPVCAEVGSATSSVIRRPRGIALGRLAFGQNQTHEVLAFYKYLLQRYSDHLRPPDQRQPLPARDAADPRVVPIAQCRVGFEPTSASYFICIECPFLPLREFALNASDCTTTPRSELPSVAIPTGARLIIKPAEFACSNPGRELPEVHAS
jgi:hypothetical protein